MINFAPAKMFFTAAPVVRAVDRATRKVLSKFGAFVRQRAKTSIRPKKGRGSAPAGSPPYSHTGLLRRFIYFGYDPRKRSVVIGPARFKERSPYGPTTVPEILEEGGVVQAREDGKRVTRRFGGHPYMGPAFEAEKPNLPALWANSVKK